MDAAAGKLNKKWGAYI